jgi:hypothetical protein
MSIRNVSSRLRDIDGEEGQQTSDYAEGIKVRALALTEGQGDRTFSGGLPHDLVRLARNDAVLAIRLDDRVLSSEDRSGESTNSAEDGGETHYDY